VYNKVHQQHEGENGQCLPSALNNAHHLHLTLTTMLPLDLHRQSRTGGQLWLLVVEGVAAVVDMRVVEVAASLEVPALMVVWENSNLHVHLRRDSMQVSFSYSCRTR